MAVVVDPSDEEEFLSYVKAENIEYSKTAVVTDTGRLVMRLNGEEVLNLSRAFIDTNGAEKEASVHVTLGNPTARKDDTAGFAVRLNQLAAELNIASQKGLVEMFDNTIAHRQS
jgi:phosphoribosylformylglycinamidine synthase